MLHCLSNDQCVILQSHAAYRSQQKILTWESLRDMSNGFQGLCCNLLKVPLVEFCTNIRKYYPTSSMWTGYWNVSSISVSKWGQMAAHPVNSRWVQKQLWQLTWVLFGWRVTYWCKEHCKYFTELWKIQFCSFFLKWKLHLIFIK